MMMTPPAQANRRDNAVAQMDRVVHYLNARLADIGGNGDMATWEARRIVVVAKSQIDGKLPRAGKVRFVDTVEGYVNACHRGMGGESQYGRRFV